jgi:hypothetical protein
LESLFLLVKQAVFASAAIQLGFLRASLETRMKVEGSHRALATASSWAVPFQCKQWRQAEYGCLMRQLKVDGTMKFLHNLHTKKNISEISIFSICK